MKDKKIFSKELAYVIGMILLPIAVAICVKADLGLSMIAAPTKVLSEYFPLTQGQFEWIFQAVVLVVMCIIIRKFKFTYLTSFVSALIYGGLLDFFNFLLKDWNVESLAMRVVCFVAGMVLTSISIAFIMNTYLAPCSYDYFVRVVVEEKNLNLRKFKLCFDFTFLFLAVAFTLILFHGFGKCNGVSWGTLVVAICNGNLIASINKWLNKKFEFKTTFEKLEKYF